MQGGIAAYIELYRKNPDRFIPKQMKNRKLTHKAGDAILCPDGHKLGSWNRDTFSTETPSIYAATMTARCPACRVIACGLYPDDFSWTDTDEHQLYMLAGSAT